MLGTCTGYDRNLLPVSPLFFLLTRKENLEARNLEGKIGLFLKGCKLNSYRSDLPVGVSTIERKLFQRAFYDKLPQSFKVLEPYTGAIYKYIPINL